ncbi:hypothetical protein E0K83_03835 [Gramella sp. BOM4]|nr:hypothetical protein [Christiangramia bathymodioli]
MKNLLSLIFILLLSCSPNRLEQENMEMLWVEFQKPEVYNFFDASKPETSWIEYSCTEGPYLVRISPKLIEVETDKPMKKALHLTGKYGRDAIEIKLTSDHRFRLRVEDPDPYGEVIRIYF